MSKYTNFKEEHNLHQDLSDEEVKEIITEQQKCSFCGDDKYTEGIDQDDVHGCKKCCEKMGMTGGKNKDWETEIRADERKRIREEVKKNKIEKTHDKGIKNEDCLCYREALNAVLNLLK